jgi:ATP-dependent DNA helicase RecQ
MVCMDTTAAVAERHLVAVLDASVGPGASPRPDQVAAVAATLEPHARVLVVQATGWGKSAVYWASTRALRAAGAGPTLVVSPLLALMRDQAAAAERAGLRAATVNSANVEDWDSVFAALDADEVDVLLVSPERLGNPRFAASLPGLLAKVGLIVVDEAHCVSDWGFDFRPDYQRLARALLAAENAAVLATTATANQRVTDDVAGQLGADAVVFRGTLARTSLRLSVVPGLSPLERYAWVADALDHVDGSGIVYVLTVAEADRLAGFLNACGHRVAAYTGALDAPARVQIEEQLRNNTVKAVVATSALGMGYDKPDLAFCIHVGSPATPVAYYQQVGRAGRGVAHAEAVLLPGSGDERIWEYFATASIPDPAHAAAVLAALSAGDCTQGELETLTGIRRGRLEALLKILNVAGAVAKAGTAWQVTGDRYVHDAAKWDMLRTTRRTEADIMRRYAHGQGCLMMHLQTSLDDPEPEPCGKCSACTGTLPAPGLTPSADRVAAARVHLRGSDIAVEPRKLWPSGVSRTGRIAGAGPGRAVAFADDAGWHDDLAEFAHGRLTDDLAAGVVATLARWRRDWDQRPVAVVVAPGPDVERSRVVAAHVAAVGNLPVVEPFTFDAAASLPGAESEQASAAAVATLERTILLDPAVQLPAGPVLLVAASMRSGWTVTFAAALLREAGVDAVLPLVVHKLP